MEKERRMKKKKQLEEEEEEETSLVAINSLSPRETVVLGTIH